MTFSFHNLQQSLRSITGIICILFFISIPALVLAKETGSSTGNYTADNKTAGRNLAAFSRFKMSRLLPGCTTALNLFGGTPYYDNDCMADLAVWRQYGSGAPAAFFSLGSSQSNLISYYFGANGDIPLGGDYDGDGRSDYAVYRPVVLPSPTPTPGNEESHWYIVKSSTGQMVDVDYGTPAYDHPMPADIDGDQRTDLVIFRREASNGNGPIPIFYKCVLPNADLLPEVKCGSQKIDVIGPQPNSAIIPIVGNFQLGNPNTADVGIWKVDTGEWIIKDPVSLNTRTAQWGTVGDIPVPGVYKNGPASDQITDFAVWREDVVTATATWWIMNSDGGTRSIQFGQPGDKPVPGDYDADGFTDIAVWRPSGGYFHIMGSASGNLSVQFGMAGDWPIAQPKYPSNGLAVLPYPYASGGTECKLRICRPCPTTCP